MNLKLAQGLAALVIIVGAVNLAAHSAKAEDESFKKKHPRRAEVNGRAKNQQKQIQQGENNGTLNQKQSNHIEQQEGAIKSQERRDVRQNEANGNGATLSKSQQNQLNREQNHTEREIKHDEKGNAQPPAAPAPAAPPVAAPVSQ